MPRKGVELLLAGACIRSKSRSTDLVLSRQENGHLGEREDQQVVTHRSQHSNVGA